MGITYATRIWLADLLASGWEADIVEKRETVQTYRLRLADDLEEAVRERVSPAGVWVAARKGASVVFIGCASVDVARELVESATREAEAA